jgi:hypothetical protein
MAKQVDKSRLRALDPRRALALEYYTDPTSETFSDAKNSLQRAGFSDSYSLQSTNLKWLQAHRAQHTIDTIKLAEDKLTRYLKIDVALDSKLNVDIAKLQADLLKFALDRLANKKYGKGTEQVAPAITVNIVAPKAPSATRDAQVVEPEALEE